MDVEQIQLLSCPFCGGAAWIDRTNGDERVSYQARAFGACANCGARSAVAVGDTSKGPYADNSTVEKRAALNWNTRAPQWQPIEFNEDGEPTNVPADTPILVPPTKRLGMTVAKWNPLDGWETETTSEWVSMYAPKHFQTLPSPPEVPDGRG